MSMAESGVPEPKAVGIGVQARPEPQSPSVASGNTLNDMRWSVAEGSTEATGSRAGGIKQTNDPNELGGLPWSVAPADTESGGFDSDDDQTRVEDQSAHPVTDAQVATSDSGAIPEDRMAGTEWSVAQPTQESGVKLQSMDVANLSGQQLVEAITAVSQNPSVFDQATLDGLSNHPQMTEALRALDDPSEASQQLSQVTAEATRRVAESVQRVANESFNPQATAPENVLDHLRKVAAKPGAMTGEELVKLHAYLQDSSDSANLTNQLVDLDPKVFDHMQTLSQELERRGMRSEELVRAAATLLNPDQAEAIAAAKTVDLKAADLDIEQVIAGQVAEITAPDGKQYSIQDVAVIFAWLVSDVVGWGNGESFDMIANWMGEKFLLKIGIDPEVVTRLSRESNMSLRSLDMLNQNQLNEWFGKHLRGREIYNLLKLFTNDERVHLMNGEKFTPDRVRKDALEPKTIAEMLELLRDDGITANELAKIGLSYPAVVN